LCSPDLISQMTAMNNASPEWELRQCLHELISLRAHRQPDSPALWTGQGTMTYSELDSKSTMLARQLISLGVRPGSLVPICLSKSTVAVLAMLAIMKAGGAFVPLDPLHPTQRLADLVQRTGAKLILSSANTRNSAEFAGPRVVEVEQLLSRVTSVNEIDGVCPAPDPEGIAYVLFTSGSTGVPKGVVVPHRAVCCSIRAHSEAMNINTTSRSLQFASYTFDACICEIFSVLVAGGTVCIPSEEERVHDLAGFITRSQANWAFFTPTVIRTLGLSPSQVPSLRTLVLGGEVVTVHDARTWAGHVSLFNGYGPTETCVFCATTPIHPDGVTYGRIGRPIGCAAWVVRPDNHDILLPPGCPGELLIEGPIVSQGYLNDPVRTQEAFITHPAWAQNRKLSQNQSSARRFYKTGDLVRQSPDGTLVYMARLDSQVKINGQRLDLGEIRHQIHSVVSEDVQVFIDLLPPTCLPNEKALLVAFLASTRFEPEQTSGFSPPIKALTSQLEQDLPRLLPRYMIPSVYLPLSAIPLTSGGKVDRQALRRRVSRMSMKELLVYTGEEQGTKLPISTAEEQQMQMLWAEVLRIPPETIGASDHFFRLGADSIDGMKLVALAQRHGILITLADIFRSPRLSDLATLLESPAHPDDSKHDLKSIIPAFSLLNVHSRNTVLKEIKADYALDVSQIEDIYPCTPLQESLMAASIQSHGAYVHHLVEKLPPSGEVPAIMSAWQSVIKMTPILRTRIVQTVSAGLLQVVLKESVQWLHRRQAIQEYLDEDARHSMTLGDPLLRLACLHDPGTPHTGHIVITIHHSIYDGWSLPHIRKLVYATQNGHPCSTSLPFNRFIHYLERKSDSRASDSFWQSFLYRSQPLAFPPLPSTGYQPVGTDSVQLSVHWPSTFPPSAFTLSTFVRVAWALVLGSYSGTDDVIFGLSLSGRDTPIPGILDILGPTICTVPFRVKFSGESIGALLERAHADSAAMLPYQHIGLHHIRQLGPDCQLACDFQTLLVIQPARDPSDPEPHSELTFTSSGGLTYAFALICQPHPSGIELHGDFDSNCVSRPVAERLLSQMKSVMGTLIFGDRRKLAAEVDVIDISQKATLATWQREPLQPGEGRVEDLIISRAQQAPDDLAIHAWDGELTYNELVEESATLAENLKRRGIGPGMLVPLCFVKSIYYVVTLLAVTRTGAAFVPIDPDAPIERMQKILKLTNACCILTSASLAEQTRAKAPARVAVFAIPLDRSARMSTDSDLMPGQSIVSHEAVYVLFTSGSTGIPKGVVVTHSSMKASLKAHGRRLGLSESSRVLQFSNHTFDVSLLEILTTLAYGGCVCIPSDGDRVNRLSEYMRDAKVNFAILTPSMARILSPVSVPDLRTLALAGEAWGQEIVNIWRDSVRLFNAYGPTEATILSAIGEVDAQCFRPNNIGSGSGALCWVTSPTDPTRLMAIGAAGELLLEGPILAQGYLGEEEKTRAAFIDPPMWRRELSSHGAPPCRSSLYRTGDLARYEEDGSITYLGRMDGQVKIRGQRTELSEIEHHILASDAVRNAVVLLRKNKLVCVLSLQSTSLTPALSRPGDIRPVSDDDRDAALRICLSIRAGLARKVPEYMVPDLWVPVIDLPLSSSGKLARKGVDDWLASVGTKHLINLSLQKIPLSTTSPSPNIASSSVERAIRQVIAGALQLPVQQVSVDAPFTALGGDSITAILVASKLRNMGILLTMRDILEFPSIQHLASREDLTAPSPANLPLDVEQVNVPFELTPIQRFFFCFFPDGANHFNQSILVRVARRFTYDQWITSLRALVQRHGMLRARFSNVDNNLQQRITDESEGACCVKWHTLEAMDPSYISTALDRCERRIDIFQGPICAVEIFDFPHEQIFFIAAHHLVMDFVSQQILLKDLDSLLAGEELSTPRPLSFQAWSLKQIEYGSNLALSPQAVLPHHENVPLANLNYWGIAAMDSCYADSAVRVLEFDSTVTSSLVGDANRAFNSEPIELFIASLLHSFANTFTDRSAPAIFKEGHGRQTREPRLDPSSTVGWFTTITPIALAVSPQLSTFEDTLRRVKDICRAIPANGFDYFTSRFLNASGSSAFQSHGPMMEIVLNYAGVLNNVQQGGTLFCPIATEEQRQMRYHDINPQLRRFAVFDIYAQVAGGKLSFTFAYSPSLNYQDRISAWIESLRRLLEAISVDLPAKQPQKTLADYPRARLDYTALERLHKDIIPSLYPAKLDDVWECSPTQTVMLRARSYQPLFFSPHFIWKIAGTKASEGNRERLTKAWKRIVARHSVLRSVFTSQLTATYHQIVLANPPFFITWADMAGKESPSEALRRLPPLPSDELHLAFRLTASEDDEGDLFCRLDINHALIDHVSINVILSDVIAVYGGQPMDSDSAFSTFRDYVEYSHLRLVDGEPYWQDRLHDACPCVLTQRPYRQIPGVLFSKSVSVNASALKALCLSSGFTLASLFQACWAVLLQRYVGSDDVLFGYIASNRGLPIRGIDRMVGPLISILPRRVRLSPSASSVSEQVRAIAKHIHEQLHDDLEHHMSAGNTMAEVIQRGRCIEELLFPFDTAINFRSQPSAAVNSVSSDPTSPLQFADGQDPMPFSLLLAVDDSPSTCLVNLHYWSSHLSSEFVDRVGGDLENLVLDVMQAR
ncbi:Nonribosomal peptide synthetase 8, partial [Aspergillus fumigatus]